MRTRSIILVLLVIIGLRSFADSTAVMVNSNAELFKIGNEAYKNNDYESSIDYYQRIIDNNEESADVYFNLGNAYFKLGDLPHSILYYEKAKKLAPDDEDILINLEIANLKTIDKVESKPEIPIIAWWNTLLNMNLIDDWATKSIVISFIAFGIMLLFLFTSGWVKKISFFVGLSVFFISFFFYILGSQQKAAHSVSRFGVVFSPSVTVKSSPEQDGTRLFVIHEGTKIKILDNEGDWTEIALMNGNKGWLKTESFKNI